MENKICPMCGSSVKGRRDKIYCSDTCRSAAKYENRLLNESFYFKIDKQLKLNRKILKKFNLEGMTTIRKKILLNQGFNPKIFTHYWKNNKGDVYLFCYEYGFLDLKEKQKFLLIVWQDYMNNGHTDN